MDGCTSLAAWGGTRLTPQHAVASLGHDERGGASRPTEGGARAIDRARSRQPETRRSRIAAPGRILLALASALSTAVLLAGCAAAGAAPSEEASLPPASMTSPEFPPGPPGPWDRYQWTWDEETPTAYCLLAAHGVAPGLVLAAFGADPQPLRMGDFGQASDLAWEEDGPRGPASLPVHSAIQLGDLDGWTVVLEPGGWACSLPEVIGPLSAHGRVVSLYTSEDGGEQVMLAEGGRVVRSLDQVLYAREGATPEEADLPFEDEDSNPDALALFLIERWSGLVFTREWLFSTPRAIHRSLREPPGG